MVNGLIKYYKLGQEVLLLKGSTDEFALTKNGEKISMSEWNPLLIAIAFKKIEIVRYFLGTWTLPIRFAGKKSTVELAQQAVDPEGEIFSLKIAVANKDHAMLEELWRDMTAWKEEHL